MPSASRWLRSESRRDFSARSSRSSAAKAAASADSSAPGAMELSLKLEAGPRVARGGQAGASAANRLQPLLRKKCTCRRRPAPGSEIGAESVPSIAPVAQQTRTSPQRCPTLCHPCEHVAPPAPASCCWRCWCSATRLPPGCPCRQSEHCRRGIKGTSDKRIDLKDYGRFLHGSDACVKSRWNQTIHTLDGNQHRISSMNLRRRKPREISASFRRIWRPGAFAGVCTSAFMRMCHLQRRACVNS